MWCVSELTRGARQQVVWGFGHTHWSSDNIINSTRVVSNQCGYITTAPDGKGSNYFDPAMVVDVRGAYHILLIRMLISCSHRFRGVDVCACVCYDCWAQSRWN